MKSLSSENVHFCYGGLFSTDGEWIHPSRTEKTYELIYVTNSQVFLTVGSEPVCADKGQLLVLEPGICHTGSQTTVGTSFYWVHFRLDGGELPFSKRFFPHFENSYLFKELLHYSFLPASPEYLVNAILVRLLAEMQYLAQGPAENADQTAEEIFEWLRSRVSAQLTVAEAAAHFGYSKDHITRLLRRQYGIGAKELIDSFLLNAARDRLANTGRYIKEIAGELGFSSDKAFIAFFKYHEGLSPSTFRNSFFKIHMNSR